MNKSLMNKENIVYHFEKWRPMRVVYLSMLLVVFFANISISSKAQESNKNGIYVDSVGKVFIQANRKIYFYIATDTAQNPQRMDINNGKKLKNFMQISKDGVHHVRHRNVVTNEVEDIVLNVDGIAPITTMKITNSSKSSLRGSYCYDSTMTFSLKAVDNMSKVNHTYISINNGGWKEYSGTKYFNKDGEYDIKYYSCDNVGNIEDEKNVHFYVDVSPPKVELEIEGRRIDSIFNTKTLLRLSANDNLSGVNKIYYQIDGGKWNVYNGDNIPIKQLDDDWHTVKYYATDKVKNESDVQAFEFYLDKKAPLASLIALGDKYVVQNRTYFSGRTKLVLIALDNKAGVDSIMYSTDNKKFIPYKDAFYLASSPGKHMVRYYAIDKLGNKGVGDEEFSVYAQKSDIFIVDLLGPDIFYKLMGNYIKRKNNILINAKTNIRISAKDKESGLKYIQYAIDDDTTEIKYTGEMNIEQITHNKDVVLKFSALDNVNNRNVLPITFVLDAEGPKIFHYFGVEVSKNEGELPIVPAYSKLFLAATDSLAGVKTIKYAINGGKYVMYKHAISNFVRNKVYAIKVLAIDNLENESEYSFTFKTK